MLCKRIHETFPRLCYYMLSVWFMKHLNQGLCPSYMSWKLYASDDFQQHWSYIRNVSDVLFLSFCLTFDVTSQAQDRPQRHLVRNSFIVELVEGHRKLRHLFLFNDVIVCAKYKVSIGNTCKLIMWLLNMTLFPYFCVLQRVQYTHTILFCLNC